MTTPRCVHPRDIACNHCTPRESLSPTDRRVRRIEAAIFGLEAYYTNGPEVRARIAALEAERRDLLADREDFADEWAGGAR